MWCRMEHSAGDVFRRNPDQPAGATRAAADLRLGPAAAEMLPRHLADLAAAGRKALPGGARPDVACGPSWCRPRTTSARPRRRPRGDDRPAGRPARELVSRRCFPSLMTAVRAPCRPTRAPPARRCGSLFDGALVESVLMRYPTGRPSASPARPGCAHGLPVLRHRPGRSASATLVDRRDRRAGRGRPPARWPRRGPGGPAGCPTSSSWAWASRSPTTSAVVGAVHAPHRPRAATASGMSARGITVSTVGLVPGHPQAGRGGHPGHAGAARCTPRDDELRNEPRADQPAVEPRRRSDAALGLRPGHRAPGVHRVRR